MKALTKIFTGYASLVMVARPGGDGFRAEAGLPALSRSSFFLCVLLFPSCASIAAALVLLAVIIVGGIYFGPRDVFFVGRIKALSAEKNGLTGNGRVGLWKAAVELLA